MDDHIPIHNGSNKITIFFLCIIFIAVVTLTLYALSTPISTNSNASTKDKGLPWYYNEK